MPRSGVKAPAEAKALALSPPWRGLSPRRTQRFCRPVQDVPGPPAAAEAAQRRFDAAVRDAAPLIPDYRLDPLGQTAVAGQLAEGRLALVAASARVFADPPGKAGQADAPTLAARPSTSTLNSD